jgi:hypothetical protein
MLTQNPKTRTASSEKDGRRDPLEPEGRPRRRPRRIIAKTLAGLHPVKGRAKIADICLGQGSSEAIFYVWKKMSSIVRCRAATRSA